MGAGVDPREVGNIHHLDLLEQADRERSGLNRPRPSAGGFREYSTARQDLLLAQVRRALVAAAARREHASMRERRLRRSADRLLEQARRAGEAGRDGAAQQSLAWRDSIREHAAELDAEQAELRAEQERLTDLARRLQAGLPVTNREAAPLLEATLAAPALDAPALAGPALAPDDACAADAVFAAGPVLAPDPVLAADPVRTADDALLTDDELLSDAELLSDDDLLPDDVLLSGDTLRADRPVPAVNPAATVAVRRSAELVPVTGPAELLQLAKRAPRSGSEAPSGAELC